MRTRHPFSALAHFRFVRHSGPFCAFFMHVDVNHREQPIQLLALFRRGAGPRGLVDRLLSSKSRTSVRPHAAWQKRRLPRPPPLGCADQIGLASCPFPPTTSFPPIIMAVVFPALSPQLPLPGPSRGNYFHPSGVGLTVRGARRFVSLHCWFARP